MLVTQRDIMRVIEAHSSTSFDFQMYSDRTEQGYSTTEVMVNHSFLPAGSRTVSSKDAQGTVLASISLKQFIGALWESLATISMAGEFIAKRSAYKQPMISRNDELFSQELFQKLVEDDVMASKNGREVIVPDLPEAGAASLMRGFKAWREKGGE